MQPSSLCRLVASSLLIVSSARAASESESHYHSGKLTPYDIGPPSLLLSAKDEAQLRSGKAVMQAVVADDAQSRRLIMVQDIATPASVVMDRIMDVDHYDRMVSGVDACVTYANNDGGASGVRTVKSTYDISALHLKMRYFVEHTYDPSARCMTFRLDYSKRSDLDDTVGYWYVEPTGRTSCRVFYSCECQLRGWVPPPVYNVLTKEALKKATTWVSAESLKEWKAQQARDKFGMIQLVGNVRDFVDNVKLPQLPQPPRLAANWLDNRRQAAVRFVSAVRPPQKASRL
jgi:hypothetical protein